MRSSQVQQQFQKRGQQSVSSRLLIRKISKCLDAKDLTIAQQEQRIKALEAKIEELRPKKRERLARDPNERFVQIWEDKEDQADIAATPEAQDDIEMAEDVEEIHSCIVVEF